MSHHPSDQRLETLPDLLCRDMRILSIGLNPSIRSVEAGFYFANPRNRFWTALNRAQIIPEVLTPGPAAQQRLLEHYRIGFTDVVKRATRGSHELKAADFREWAPVLEAKLLAYQPRVAWFHGKHAYRNYLRCTSADRDVSAWGRQPLKVGQSAVFVTPNPSPANAAFGMETLVEFYRELAVFLTDWEESKRS